MSLCVRQEVREDISSLKVCIMKSRWAWPDHITSINNVIKIAASIACMLTPWGRAVTPALRAQ